jgi:hypothetical protein
MPMTAEGVVVLSFPAGNFGDIVRVVLIGAVPPSAINDWHISLSRPSPG